MARDSCRCIRNNALGDIIARLRYVYEYLDEGAAAGFRNERKFGSSARFLVHSRSRFTRANIRALFSFSVETNEPFAIHFGYGIQFRLFPLVLENWRSTITRSIRMNRSFLIGYGHRALSNARTKVFRGKFHAVFISYGGISREQVAKRNFSVRRRLLYSINNFSTFQVAGEHFFFFFFSRLRYRARHSTVSRLNIHPVRNAFISFHRAFYG